MTEEVDGRGQPGKKDPSANLVPAVPESPSPMIHHRRSWQPLSEPLLVD